MEIIALTGFVFAAAALGALVYDYQTDVLRGPYIEGRARAGRLAAILERLRPLTDKMTFRVRHAVYLASFA